MLMAFGYAAPAYAVPITQCPGVQSNPTGCQFLITRNSDGTFTTTLASNVSDQGPYEGSEDALVGIQNNAATPLVSLSLTATSAPIDIFGFDGDGACAAINCGNNDPLAFGYGGRVSTTPSFSTTGPNVTYGNINATFSSGTVFFGPNGIAPGGSAWFSLEEAFTLNTFPVIPAPSAVPEPGTLTLLATGLGFACRRYRRQ